MVTIMSFLLACLFKSGYLMRYVLIYHITTLGFHIVFFILVLVEIIKE
jgi:hypothetical protein